MSSLLPKKYEASVLSALKISVLVQIVTGNIEQDRRSVRDTCPHTYVFLCTQFMSS